MVSINVKTRLALYSVDVTDTVSVKDVVEACGGSATDKLFCTKEGVIVDTFQLVEGSVYSVAEPLCGGGKKRKKKKFTTPKRKPHVKKKVKLHVLQFYKVEEDGSVIRQRRMCPSNICGAGVFMANHHDRVYCGRCYKTHVPGAK